MNSEELKLPQDLQTRLNIIIQTIPEFWDKQPYKHFTNHGPAHSERIHNQKLAQLAQELPESRRLTNDEIFIVSAAARLYEIGMQSPKLKPTLDFEAEPDESLSFSQRQEIRANKHLLTERLIKGDYEGPPIQLGLTHPADSYTGLIATVCRWCSDDPLEDIPETLPVGGIPVRVRLLVALLRLADQLYIEPSRVDMDLLQYADLSQKELARWWAYHYTQTLPIQKGQIPFHYSLPVTQKEYLGHIRTLIEPDFEYDNNPVISYLWDEHELRLMPHKRPSIGFDQPGGFQREMDYTLIGYLRRKITPQQTSMESSYSEMSERCLFVLDYENFILELGREGFFFNQNEINRMVVTLRSEASKHGSLETLAVGHWHRPELVEVAEMLHTRVYDLLAVEEYENTSEKIEQALVQKLASIDVPKHIIVVAPPADLARPIQTLCDQGQFVNAWISNLDDADIYRSLGQPPKYLRNLLQLGKPTEMTSDELEFSQMACILRLDDVMINNKDFSFDDIFSSLGEMEFIRGPANWWHLWLANQRIIVSNDSRNQFQLNPENSDVVKVRDMRRAAILTLQTFSGEQGLPQDDFIRELLRRLEHLKNENNALNFLELLKEENIVYRDIRPESPNDQSLWSLNTSHWVVVSLNANRYLPRFALALDHVMVREGFPFLHEHTLNRHITPSMEDSLVETVYNLALTEGWINRQESQKKHRYRNENIVHISLADDHIQVGETRRNQEILLNILSHRSAREGITQGALWQKLRKVRSFTLDRDELNQWLKLFGRDSIVTITSNGQDPGQDVIKLDLDTELTQRLLGRINIHGLLKTMYVIGATRPDRKKPFSDVEERLARFVTRRNVQLAVWTLDYAKGIKLIEAEGEFVFLNRHSFVRKLNQRENAACQSLIKLVETLMRHEKEGWVPQQIVLQAMERDIQFGYVRGEHEYWLNQAIRRRKVLQEKKEKKQGRLQRFIRISPKR